MGAATAEAVAERYVSPWLATAIFALPLIFYWFLLRPGYASSTRRAALIYMFGNMLPGVMFVISRAV